MPQNDADWADWKDLRKKLEKDGPKAGAAEGEVPPVVGQPPVEQISLGMEGETDPETYVRDEL